MSSNKTNRWSVNAVWFRSENVVWGPREEEVPWNKIHYMDLSLHDHSNLEDNVYLEQLELSHWTIWFTGLTWLVDSLDWWTRWIGGLAGLTGFWNVNREWPYCSILNCCCTFPGWAGRLRAILISKKNHIHHIVIITVYSDNLSRVGALVGSKQSFTILFDSKKLNFILATPLPSL